MNPDNLSPVEDPDDPSISYFGDEVADRVPFMIRTLVYIWACLALIGVLLIFKKPEDSQVVVDDETLLSSYDSIAHLDGTDQSVLRDLQKKAMDKQENQLDIPNTKLDNASDVSSA